MMSEERNKIFISYSIHDREWAERIYRFLSIILADSDLSLWYDAKIMPGEAWEMEIKKAIETARIAILLISPSYLASHFITDFELPDLLKLAEQKKIHILPVIIRSCLIESDSPLAQYQSLGSITKPLNSLSAPEQDEALVKLGEAIYKLTGKIEFDKLAINSKNIVFKTDDSDISNIFSRQREK